MGTKELPLLLVLHTNDLMRRPRGRRSNSPYSGILRVPQKRFNFMQHLVVAKHRETCDLIMGYFGATIHNYRRSSDGSTLPSSAPVRDSSATNALCRSLH